MQNQCLEETSVVTFPRVVQHDIGHIVLTYQTDRLEITKVLNKKDLY